MTTDGAPPDEEALRNVRKGLPFLKKDVANNARSPLCHNRLGEAYGVLGQVAEALACFDRAITLTPTYAEVWCNRGRALSMLGRSDEAVQSFVQACELTPNYTEAKDLLIKVCHADGLAIPPITRSWPVPVRSLWQRLFRRGDVTEAQVPDDELSLRALLAETPDDANVLVKLGTLFLAQKRFVESELFSRHALACDPRSLQALLCLVQISSNRNLLPEALQLVAKFNPRPSDERSWATKGLALSLNTSDWSRYADFHSRLIKGSHQPFSGPFPYYLDTPNVVLFEGMSGRTILNYLRREAPPAAQSPPLFAAKARRSRKTLTIGYLSADFRTHAMMVLAGDLFSAHDCSRFRVNAYSLKSPRRNTIARRVRKGFDAVIDLDDCDDKQAARLIADGGVDILVDLMGYTTHARPAILTHRPAPVQVNWLGFPGTMGAPYVDYIIADNIIIAPEYLDDFEDRP
ncbi:MAG: tetratricopeptide repeat protein, partial [Alphaproteobacteria bacterium]|nr:tetratricopeptide repeat protein [Alphaproteobacteria bacterium]